MKYQVVMLDIPKGSSPVVEIPGDAVIVGPWQNPGAQSVGIIYLIPLGLEEEEEGEGD